MDCNRMRHRIWLVLLGPFLTLSTGAFALEGVYRVEGHGPRSTDIYKGEAQIKKTGDTYTVVWRIGESRHIGTGIVTDNVLSVFFQPLERGAAPGVASFHIVNDEVTEGSWTMLGAKEVGVETWTYDHGY